MTAVCDRERPCLSKNEIDQYNIDESFPDLDEETEPKVLKTAVKKGKKKQSQQCISGFEVPKLQNSQGCHLFVASSSDDREKVLRIVEDLENQFGIKCLFASRDFQPGKEYRLMIRDGIDTSIKVLLMFTPNFVDSAFCQLEAELSYLKSIERRNDCVIPVLLEDCEVPTVLKPRNYIDATQPGMDLHTVTIRIMEALVRIESPTNVVPFKFRSADGEEKDENGLFVDIHAVNGRTRNYAYDFTAPRFYLRRKDMQDIQSIKINVNAVTPKLLKRTMKMLNDDPTTRKFHFLDQFMPWIMGFYTYPFTLFLCLAIFLGRLLSESTSYPSEDIASFVRAGHWIAWLPLLVIAAVSLTLTVYKRFMVYKIGKGIPELKSKLWKEVTAKTFKDGVVFSLFDKKEVVELCFGIKILIKVFLILRVMKYDSTPCKRYIMMLLRGNGPDEKTDQELEQSADDVIREYLKQMCIRDFNLDTCLKADYKRHGVAGSKMCICQHYENMENLESQRK